MYQPDEGVKVSSCAVPAEAVLRGPEGPDFLGGVRNGIALEEGMGARRALSVRHVMQQAYQRERNPLLHTLPCCCPGSSPNTATILPPGITYLTNSKVTAASVANRTLTLANGDVVSYEKLIIATGARVGHWGGWGAAAGTVTRDPYAGGPLRGLGQVWEQLRARSHGRWHGIGTGGWAAYHSGKEHSAASGRGGMAMLYPSLRLLP